MTPAALTAPGTRPLAAGNGANGPGVHVGGQEKRSPTLHPQRKLNRQNVKSDPFKKLW